MITLFENFENFAMNNKYKNKNKIKIKKSDSDLWDEYYCRIYECSSCNESEIMERHKFCPMCGVELEWVDENE